MDEMLLFARQVIQTEARAVGQMESALNGDFVRAVQLILDCRGTVVVSGIGKAGHVARKLSATFASTGTPSHFLSAGDALHGDVGAVRQGDIVLLLSASGESDEILRLLSLVKKLDHPVIGITCAAHSGLGRHSDIALVMGALDEACPLRLAPSASTTAMLALGDALALTVMQQRNFTADDFAVFHPAGQLGRNLIKVGEAMTFRAGQNLPVAGDHLTVGEVLHQVSSLRRRSGAIVLVDHDGKMTGLFTDSDLRRVVISDDGAALKRPVREVMTRNPTSISPDELASHAMALMRQHRFDELPVVDADRRPLGLIDVQDLVVLRMLDVTDH